jgi:hypothetical protein
MGLLSIADLKTSREEDGDVLTMKVVVGLDCNGLIVIARAGTRCGGTTPFAGGSHGL